MMDFKEKFKSVEHLARTSKLNRLLRNPFKYLIAIGHRHLIYPVSKRGYEKNAILFFGKQMKVMLPSGTDIYLTGGKSHDSEIRLAKFIMNKLNPNDTFLDVGAHYGYFTLLASEIVKPNGKVFAFEASKKTYAILNENIADADNIYVFNNAVSDTNEQLDFFELPDLYSEYNSINPDQYQTEKWFAKIKPQTFKIDCVKLDDISDKYHVVPNIIKIDVEGAEHKVLSGAYNLLKSGNCIIIMEYVNESRGNIEHNKAIKLLEGLGYSCHVINRDGELFKEADVNSYLVRNDLESDNLVFVLNKEYQISK